MATWQLGNHEGVRISSWGRITKYLGHNDVEEEKYLNVDHDDPRQNCGEYI